MVFINYCSEYKYSVIFMSYVAPRLDYLTFFKDIMIKAHFEEENVRRVYHQILWPTLTRLKIDIIIIISVIGVV